MPSARQSITAFVLPGAPTGVSQWIRPARAPRDWMDRSPERYAYRCIPLSAANTMGWELLNPVACDLAWSGEEHAAQLAIRTATESRFGPRSHFGSGVVTWELPYLFRTPPEYGLVVTGPANHDKAHITPLDGFVRSDWLPFPFTVNWRLTAPHQVVRFAHLEPIARIFPFPLDLLEDFALDIRDLGDDAGVQQAFQDWRAQRVCSYRARAVAAAGEHESLDRNAFWSRRYARGVGAEPPARRHQTVFRCQPVRDRRSEPESGASGVSSGPGEPTG